MGYSGLAIATANERNEAMSTLIQWMISSTWFKKYAAIVGAFCLGVYAQDLYWQKINAVLAALGVTQGEFRNTLLLIVGASGVAASIGLSLVKSSQAKATGTGDGGKP